MLGSQSLRMILLFKLVRIMQVVVPQLRIYAEDSVECGPPQNQFVLMW
ncbi:hypothetical protein SLEP1_g35416 [Rubroshorea leprosula]|uniref:Uncharacterized protein n=1 Tax=Rubroshorea leprosula TaxID=152421 RepID=A0AAV5KNE0_9ROSI|nr:hypothetical protein SLEP1_g35416 [Rubroshorea leprosula]